MCPRCYKHAQDHDELYLWPRFTQRGPDLVEEYIFLVDIGEVKRLQDAAPLLGVTYDALRLAVKRHLPKTLREAA